MNLKLIKNKKMEKMEKTSLGMDENIEGLLCYILGWLTGIIFYILEKENKFVRFHAMQSTITFLALFVVSIALTILGAVMSFIPYMGWIIGIVFSLLQFIIFVAGFILWVVGMVKAYQGEKYKFPIAGNMAEKYV